MIFYGYYTFTHFSGYVYDSISFLLCFSRIHCGGWKKNFKKTPHFYNHNKHKISNKLSVEYERRFYSQYDNFIGK